MVFAFGDSAVVASDFGQMDLLSSQEMIETEGEFYPFLVAGGKLKTYASGIVSGA